MKLRISLHARYLGLLAALGVVPLACDSTISSDFVCSDSQPVTANGQDTGYAVCSEGQRHRPEAVTCASTLPRADACTSGSTENDCSTDADCTDGANGYCANSGQADWCSCQYGCVSDADCGDGFICMCGEPVGHCVPATCTTDGDCEDELLCVAYTSEPGCGGMRFTCQTEDDECASDTDCTQGAQCTKRNGKLVCEEISCAIGRPFLVHGGERLADACGRGDWLADLEPEVDGIEPAVRAQLAERWTEIGLMEHASIAAFARFSLQLLAQGAPAALVEASQDAMRDETRHARLCFALASAYAGRRIGPGALPIDGALDDGDADTILRLVIREGCIGETVAAIEAAEAAAHAVDPVVRQVLTQIAADEQRHAELAWRYVAWTLKRDARLAAVLRQEITRAGAEAPDVDATRETRLQHGIVSDAMRCALRGRALREVIAPCARALAASITPQAAAVS